MGKTDILKKGVTPGATWAIIKHDVCPVLVVQPTETKPGKEVVTMRGSIEETKTEYRPERKEGETRAKYSARLNYAKKLVKENGGKPPKKWPDGWKVEAVEVTEKRKGIIETTTEKLVRKNKGKAVQVNLYHVPSVSAINTIVSNVLKSI